MAVTLSDLQVLDDHRVGQSGVGATQFVRNAGMRLRHALDVGLVDDRLVIGRAGGAVRCPVEERVDHHAGHGVAQRIDHRGRAGLRGVLRRRSQVVGEQRLAEVEIADERLSVGVEQKLAGITPVTGRRVERAVHPEPVALPGRDGRQVAMPDVAVDFVESDGGFDAVVGDQAQLDLLGDFGEQRKVGAGTVVGGPERKGRAGPHRRKRGGRIGGLGRALGRRHY